MEKHHKDTVQTSSSLTSCRTELQIGPTTMITINFDALNPLEQTIHAILKEHSLTVETIRITEAADLCDCSVSKISKFAKKLGFANYKQYLDFLYGRDVPGANLSSELHRLEKFIEGFDSNKVDELVRLIASKDKLVMVGYGPSYQCAQYFEYRFKTCSKKMAIAVPDEYSASTMIDENSLLLVLTVTGTFKSFEDIYKDTKQKGGEVAIIVEEYNSEMLKLYDKIFCLTNETQSQSLQPYEKSRTIFFIFLEEVVRRMMQLAIS